KIFSTDNKINNGSRTYEPYDVHKNETTSLILKRRGVTGDYREHVEQPRQRADHREIARQFNAAFFGSEGEVRPDNHRGQTDKVVNHEQRRVVGEHTHQIHLLHDEPSQINDRIPEEQVSAQARFDDDNRGLKAKRDDEERLMVIETNAIPEKCKV